MKRDRVTKLWLDALEKGNDDNNKKTRLNRKAVSIKKFKNTGAESLTELNVAEKRWEEKIIEKKKKRKRKKK